MSLAVEVVVGRRRTLVAVAGRLDSSSAAEQLADTLALAGGDITVDLTGVTVIDQLALSALIDAHTLVSRRGDQLAVKTSERLARRVLADAGVRVIGAIDRPPSVSGHSQ
jgi:anti-anti-sigma regulatory factor